MQGWRLEMEDAHISIDLPSQPDHLLLGVFDGHAGAGAAKFASKHFVDILESDDKYIEYRAGGCQNIELLAQAMRDVFLKIDDRMRSHQEGEKNDSSGCTSVTAIVTPKYILCANAGDSRCVLGTGGVTKPLSEDHKPLGEIEKRRIDQAGGFVQWNRVDGDLAVSRAFGDFSYKNRPDLSPHEQKITCFPDIAIHERHDTDDVLILACDGLWDVMSSEAAVNSVRELYQSGEQSVLKIAEEMIDLALLKGSKDNISSIIVKLPGAILGPVENGGVDAIRANRNKSRSTEDPANTID